MVRRWYYNKQNGQRLLAVEEVASACCVSGKEVKNWFGGNLTFAVNGDDFLIDSGDVVAFLVKNCIPVAPSLLPPNTKKILFISSDENELQEREDILDRICRFFAESSNIIAESSSAGRFADLSVFTFSPNIVVIFLKTYDWATANTLNLLSILPEPKTLLFLDNSIKIAVEEGLVKLSADLVVSDTLPAGKLMCQLRTAFRG